ncbi:putative holin [Pseudothermotoga thermarum]|uniref:putative holin n=1 Tax=Pseudothermotoga thermarum TaxID=119394 RepID=UPI00059C345A|nr:hypothetical protein [Pseudothermotoga thermarum]
MDLFYAVIWVSLGVGFEYLVGISRLLILQEVVKPAFIFTSLCAALHGPFLSSVVGFLTVIISDVAKEWLIGLGSFLLAVKLAIFGLFVGFTFKKTNRLLISLICCFVIIKVVELILTLWKGVFSFSNFLLDFLNLMLLLTVVPVFWKILVKSFKKPKGGREV